jgi:hypothetical protein
MKRTAYIHTAPTGRYHVTDDSMGCLDERGDGHSTIAAALRAASDDGYTHVAGLRDGKIPARYRS